MPTVTSIVPNAGPPAGGTVVLVNGTNFTTDATVNFGATQVPGTYISPVQLQATAPAGTPGTVHVQVVTPNGTSAINTIEDANPGDDLFTYTIGPIIASLNPLNGPMTGGHPRHHHGHEFRRRRIGDIRRDPLRCRELQQRHADYRAPSADRHGQRGRCARNYERWHQPRFYAFEVHLQRHCPGHHGDHPNAGPTVGGQSVNITGSGFLGVTCPTGVKFGTVTAASCTVNSDTSITAVSPANVPGQTFLTVSYGRGHKRYRSQLHL